MKRVELHGAKCRRPWDGRQNEPRCCRSRPRALRSLSLPGGGPCQQGATARCGDGRMHGAGTAVAVNQQPGGRVSDRWRRLGSGGPGLEQATCQRIEVELMLSLLWTQMVTCGTAHGDLRARGIACQRSWEQWLVLGLGQEMHKGTLGNPGCGDRVRMSAPVLRCWIRAERGQRCPSPRPVTRSVARVF